MFSTGMSSKAPSNIKDAREPLIVRSNPQLDKQATVARLQQQWPVQCRAITIPINVEDYYDERDINMMDRDFLIGVLNDIHLQNEVEKMRSSLPSKPPSPIPSSSHLTQWESPAESAPTGYWSNRNGSNSQANGFHQGGGNNQLADDASFATPADESFEAQIRRHITGSPHALDSPPKVHAHHQQESRGGSTSFPSSRSEEHGPQEAFRRSESPNTLYVGNLSHEVTESEIAEAFRSFGQIRSLKLCEFSNKPFYAFVEFYTREQAEVAREQMQVWMCRGTRAVVDWRGYTPGSRRFSQRSPSTNYTTQTIQPFRQNHHYPNANAGSHNFRGAGERRTSQAWSMRDASHKSNQPNMPRIRPQDARHAPSMFTNQDVRSSAFQPQYSPYDISDTMPPYASGYGQFNTIASVPQRFQRPPFLPAPGRTQDVPPLVYSAHFEIPQDQAGTANAPTVDRRFHGINEQLPRSRSTPSDPSPIAARTVDSVSLPEEHPMGRSSGASSVFFPLPARHFSQTEQSSSAEAFRLNLPKPKPAKGKKHDKKERTEASRHGSTKSRNTSWGQSDDQDIARPSALLRSEEQRSSPRRKTSKKKKAKRPASQPAPSVSIATSEVEGTRLEEPTEGSRDSSYSSAFPELGQKPARQKEAKKPTQSARSRKGNQAAARKAEVDDAENVKPSGSQQKGDTADRRSYSQAVKLHSSDKFGKPMTQDKDGEEKTETGTADQRQETIGEQA
ncbi:MAG: hypothetical protein M4579_005622 [Chaenotheca gracillima]|nr:MAG: hypothetical protein M4579_005622 [Chaenotheca gracillima]